MDLPPHPIAAVLAVVCVLVAAVQEDGRGGLTNALACMWDDAVSEWQGLKAALDVAVARLCEAVLSPAHAHVTAAAARAYTALQQVGHGRVGPGAARVPLRGDWVAQR